MTVCNALLTLDGYWARARELQEGNGCTWREAWLMVEVELEAGFGLRRYLEYNAFRFGKSTQYRKRKKARFVRVCFYVVNNNG